VVIYASRVSFFCRASGVLARYSNSDRLSVTCWYRVKTAKRIVDFSFSPYVTRSTLLIVRCNYVSILHRFRDYWPKTRYFYAPPVFRIRDYLQNKKVGKLYNSASARHDLTNPFSEGMPLGVDDGAYCLYCDGMFPSAVKCQYKPPLYSRN